MSEIAIRSITPDMSDDEIAAQEAEVKQEIENLDELTKG